MQPSATNAEINVPGLDTLIAFENGELDQDAVVSFIQDGIDRGWVWRLQGAYGRTAAALIATGLCSA